MAVPYVFFTTPTSSNPIPASQLDDNFNYLAQTPTILGMTITPTAATLNNGLSIVQSPAGTASAALNYLNSIVIGDGMVANSSNVNVGANIMAGTLLQYNVNGAATQATNGLFTLFSDLQVYTQSAVNNQSYAAIVGRAIARTSTAITGFQITGINASVAVDAGVTGVTEIVGFEMDMTANAAASGPITKVGIAYVLGATDAKQGSGTDTANYFTMQAGTSLGWGSLFLADATNGTLISSGGNIFLTRGAITVTNGFDLSGWTYTGAVFKGPNGFSVGNGGDIHAGASVAAVASLNLPHGTAPTSPMDGDMWTTTAGLFCRINGSTIGPLS